MRFCKHDFIINAKITVLRLILENHQTSLNYIPYLVFQFFSAYNLYMYYYSKLIQTSLYRALSSSCYVYSPKIQTIMDL